MIPLSTKCGKSFDGWQQAAKITTPVIIANQLRIDIVCADFDHLRSSEIVSEITIGNQDMSAIGEAFVPCCTATTGRDDGKTKCGKCLPIVGCVDVHDGPFEGYGFKC